MKAPATAHGGGGRGAWRPPAPALQDAHARFADAIANLDARAEEYRVDCQGLVDAEVYAAFITQVRQTTESLTVACDAADEAATRQQGHSLEGMGGAVGFPELSVVGAELAAAARMGRWARCRDLAGRLRQWCAAALASAHARQVLVIDDDDAVRQVICRLLAHAGHQVREAADGQAGLQAFQAERPDVVILDMFMPGKDGVETLRDLRRLDPDVCVLATSGGGELNNLQVLQSASRMGAKGTLLKPFTYDQLQTAVAGLLQADGCAQRHPPRS